MQINKINQYSIFSLHFWGVEVGLLKFQCTDFEGRLNFYLDQVYQVYWPVLIDWLINWLIDCSVHEKLFVHGGQMVQRGEDLWSGWTCQTFEFSRQICPRESVWRDEIWPPFNTSCRHKLQSKCMVNRAKLWLFETFCSEIKIEMHQKNSFPWLVSI